MSSLSCFSYYEAAREGGLQSILNLKPSAKVAVVFSWIAAGIRRGKLLLQRDPLIRPHPEACNGTAANSLKLLVRHFGCLNLIFPFHVTLLFLFPECTIASGDRDIDGYVLAALFPVEQVKCDKSHG